MGKLRSRLETHLLQMRATAWISQKAEGRDSASFSLIVSVFIVYFLAQAPVRC